MSAKFIQVKNNEILIRGKIGDETNGVGEGEFISALDSFPAEQKVTVGINSPGGFNGAALGMFNAMKRRGNVTTRNDGYCVSAASLLLLGGSERICPQASRVMIHKPYLSGVSGNADDLRQLSDRLAGETEMFANIYASETKLTKEEAEEMMRKETWMSCADALAHGFATSIDGAISLGFLEDANNFKNVPQDILSASVNGVPPQAHATPVTTDAPTISGANDGAESQPTAEGKKPAAITDTTMSKTIEVLAELKLIPSASLGDEDVAQIVRDQHNRMTAAQAEKDKEIEALRAKIAERAKQDAEAAVAAFGVSEESKPAWVQAYLANPEATKTMLSGVKAKAFNDSDPAAGTDKNLTAKQRAIAKINATLKK